MIDMSMTISMTDQEPQGVAGLENISCQSLDLISENMVATEEGEIMIIQDIPLDVQEGQEEWMILVVTMNMIVMMNMGLMVCHHQEEEEGRDTKKVGTTRTHTTTATIMTTKTQMIEGMMLQEEGVAIQGPLLDDEMTATMITKIMMTEMIEGMMMHQEEEAVACVEAEAMIFTMTEMIEDIMHQEEEDLLLHAEETMAAGAWRAVHLVVEVLIIDLLTMATTMDMMIAVDQDAGIMSGVNLWLIIN